LGAEFWRQGGQFGRIANDFGDESPGGGIGRWIVVGEHGTGRVGVGRRRFAGIRVGGEGGRALVLAVEVVEDAALQ
jgi:hypothetical protein